MKMHTRTWGHPDRPLLLLLHALGCHSGWWAPVAERLQDYHVVAPDFRGHGDSAPADTYTFADYAADVAALIASLGNRPYLLAGHSMGGYVGLVVAATAPQPPVALCVIDMKTGASPEELTQMAAAATKPPRAYPTLDEAVGRYRLAPAEHRIPADLLSAVAQQCFRQLPDDTWTDKFDRRAMAIEALDPIGLAKEAKCPITYVRGEQSPVMPAAPAFQLAEATASKLTQIPETVHHLPLEAPGALAEILRSLA